MPHQRIELVFECLPSEVPVTQRIKALLKRAGRDWRLKCISAKELPPPGAQARNAGNEVTPPQENPS